MTDVTVVKEETGKGGRYVATVPGRSGEAKLTYTIRSPGLLSADHTFAPDEMRGTGAALALVTRMVEDARASGSKIVPVCPYVKAQAAKHSEWRDVIED